MKNKNIHPLLRHRYYEQHEMPNSKSVGGGDLIAYLGNSDENGGSKEQHSQTPHLHFGIRAGQTADYPSKGEWRYMAGWIKLCPQDIGWLQPSWVITSQDIPAGGYPEPKVPFLTHWGFEIMFTSLFMIFGVILLIRVSKQKSRFLLLLPGTFEIVAGIVLYTKGLVRSYMLLVIGMLILATGIYYFIQRPNPTSIIFHKANTPD